ncbi:MAG: hypothetical protein GC179_26960 [Anaerolineaceae bacterium]|nr:hypothetical protein [Anaerolineaceae bacterium]
MAKVAQNSLLPLPKLLQILPWTQNLEIVNLGVGHPNYLLPRFQPSLPLKYRQFCQISHDIDDSIAIFANNSFSIAG